MKFRRLNKLWAAIMGFYWMPCPICGQMYGGHEHAMNGIETGANTADMVCKDCNDKAEELNKKRKVKL